MQQGGQNCRVVSLALSLEILLGVASPARADWASEEAYLNHLKQQLQEFKAAAELFETHRRSMELVELRFANLQLPLAEGSQPDQLVRQTLKQTYPQVEVTMKRLETRAPQGVDIWRWRCTLSGALEEVRWASQLLLQKGLFIVPQPSEAVELSLQPGQQRAVLSFVGHHIRLKELDPRTLPKTTKGVDLLDTRIDPLAQEIRRVRAELASLRRRLVDILGFETRVEAMKVVLSRLRELVQGARNPFQVFTPLLELDLLQYRRMVLSGEEVAVRGAVPSESAARAARRWLARKRLRRIRLRIEELSPMYGAAATASIPLAEAPDEKARPGTRCSLWASAARAVDLGLAAGSSVILAAAGESTLSGVMTDVPFEQALQSAARALGLALLRDGSHSLLLAPSKERAARSALEGSLNERSAAPRLAGRTLGLPLFSSSVSGVLGRLRSLSQRPLEAPAALLKEAGPMTLAGAAPLESWLRRLGAAFGHGVKSCRGRWCWRRGESEESATVTVPLASKGVSRSWEQLSLSALRPRLVLRRGGQTMAVLSDPPGTPMIARAGTRLGRSRSRVIRVDQKGVTVRWSDAGVSASILLPLGESLIAQSAAPGSRRP